MADATDASDIISGLVMQIAKAKSNSAAEKVEQSLRELSQQPVEGELVPNPRPDNLSEVELKFPDFDQGILIGAQDGFDKGSKAQLAHMIQQGWVKLPSEDELALWLCDHLNCTSRELAQELLDRWPKGEVKHG